VNTNDLAKLYDRLTPAERLPLILAARRRGARYGRFLKTAVSIAYADQADS
jgi:hypothetical protein